MASLIANLESAGYVVGQNLGAAPVSSKWCITIEITIITNTTIIFSMIGDKQQIQEIGILC